MGWKGINECVDRYLSGMERINSVVCVDRYMTRMERINSVVCVDRYMTRMENINGVCGQVPEYDGKG